MSKPLFEMSLEELKDQLVSGGYICMSEEDNRKSFNKGYTNEGFAERVFHLRKSRIQKQILTYEKRD